MKKIKFFLVLALSLIVFCVPTYAAELTNSEKIRMSDTMYNQNYITIIELINDNTDVLPYVLITANYGIHSSGSPYYCNLYVTFTDVPLGKVEGLTYGAFVVTNRKTYAFNGTFNTDLTLVSQTTNNTTYEILQGTSATEGEFRFSNYDIYEMSGAYPEYPTKGELYKLANFLLPPYRQTMITAMESLKMEVQGVHSTMMILTLCGVGLIALLMVLPLFGKVFHQYRR